MGRGLLLVVLRASRTSELSEVMTVSLLLVLGPLRWPDVVRRGQDVQEGRWTLHALNSKSEQVGPLLWPPLLSSPPHSPSSYIDTVYNTLTLIHYALIRYTMIQYTLIQNTLFGAIIIWTF